MTELTATTVNNLRSTRRAARRASIGLLLGGGILTLGAMPSLPVAKACFDGGLAAMVAGSIMALVWILSCRHLALIGLLVEQERTNDAVHDRLIAQLSKMECFERRQVEVLADALEEITPHVRRYN